LHAVRTSKTEHKHVIEFRNEFAILYMVPLVLCLDYL
jgi:hypothetical protein